MPDYRIRRFTAVAALLLSARAAWAVPAYTITDLGRLPVAESGPYAWALNNTGQVAGDSGQPFLWTNGAMRSLNTALPASVFAPAPARDVNDAGVAVGSFAVGATIHPFRWEDFTFTDLAPNATSAQRAVAVNTSGDIVVDAAAPYLLKAGGAKVPLAGIVAGSVLAPAALNDAGQVAGAALAPDKTIHAALWQDGAATDLGTLPGDLNSRATALNRYGESAGISYGLSAETSTIHPWLRRGTEMAPLPGRAPFESCVPTGMNARAQVVGYVGPWGTGGEAAALLWEDGAVYDLQNLLPAGSGWTLRAARDINDAGQITGYGVHNGVYRAFLLTPVAAGPGPGDADGDGAVTIADAAWTLRVAGGRALPPDAAPSRLDVAPAPSTNPRGYGDGRVDLSDAIRVLRRAEGLEPRWP